MLLIHKELLKLKKYINKAESEIKFLSWAQIAKTSRLRRTDWGLFVWHLVGCIQGILCQSKYRGQTVDCLGGAQGVGGGEHGMIMVTSPKSVSGWRAD